jgi:hypothetical protein
MRHAQWCSGTMTWTRWTTTSPPRLRRRRGRVTETLSAAHPKRSLRGLRCRWCYRQLQRFQLSRRCWGWGCVAAADAPPVGRDCVNTGRFLLPARRTRSSNAESPRSCKPGSAPFQRSRRPTLAGAPRLMQTDLRKCYPTIGGVSAQIPLAPRLLLRHANHLPSWTGAASTAHPTPTASPPAADLDAATDAMGSSTSSGTAPCLGRRLLLQRRVAPPVASPCRSVSSVWEELTQCLLRRCPAARLLRSRRPTAATTAQQ